MGFMEYYTFDMGLLGRLGFKMEFIKMRLLEETTMISVWLIC